MSSRPKKGGQCKAPLHGEGTALTLYCTREKGHEDEHFNEGPVTWE